MKWLISIGTSSSPGSIEIDGDEYKRIKDAKQFLLEALYLEEKLDLVTENYNDYEVELLSIGSRVMIFKEIDYYSFHRDRNLVSRRIVNLLTAGRMYLDQSIHHINNIYGKDSDILKMIKNEKEKLYDGNLGFRVLEALRNYVQHRGLPIHSINISQERLDEGDGLRFLHRIIPAISISALYEDGKIKKKVLEELKSLYTGDCVDFKPLAREYIEGIGKIHEMTRELMCKDILSWEGIIIETIMKYQNKFGENTLLEGLAIVIEKEDETWEEHHDIFKDFIKRRQNLASKNKSYNNLAKCYVSNEVKIKDL